MFLREKINLVAPGEPSGRAYLSVLRSRWRQVFSSDRAQTPENQLLLARIFDRQACSPELQGLTSTLKSIRQRILANTVFHGWAHWLVWVSIALIAVAAVSSKLMGVLVFVAAVAAAGTAAVFAWAWRNRPSHYETARCLDSASGLQDRLSTAIYLGGIQDADGMIFEQRKDALARLGKVDPRGLFPIRWPENSKRVAVVVLVAAGLLAYRIQHQAPLVSLLRSTLRSQLVQSIVSPIARALEKDLQRTMAMVTMKPDAAGEEAQRADAASKTDDLWKADGKANAADDQKDAADAENQQQDQMQPPGSQEGPSSSDAREQDSNQQSQDSKNGNDENESQSQEQGEQSGPEGRQSMGQSLMQALKNMMSKTPNQHSNNRPDQQPPNGQGTPQSGNSNQPGANESDKRGDSKGNSDAKQKATQTASEGAGSQQGTKELRKDADLHPVNAVPDRVALEASGFKEQTRMKVATETGAAHLAVGNVSPRQDAVTNGAEQENIPARYRFYVQRYFEHADDGKQ